MTQESSIFNAGRSTSFQILCCVLGRSCKIWILTKFGEKDKMDSHISLNHYRNFDGIDGESMEFEWNIFTGSNSLQLSDKVQKLTVQIWRNTRKFHRKNSFHFDVQRHFLWNKKTNEQECLANARFVSLYARRFGKRTMVIQWSSWF